MLNQDLQSLIKTLLDEEARTAFGSKQIRAVEQRAAFIRMACWDGSEFHIRITRTKNATKDVEAGATLCK